MTEKKGKNSLLTAELEKVRVELADYQAREEGHWAEKKIFLESLGFFDLLGSHSALLSE